MALGKVGVSSYTRRSSTGKLVHVQNYVQDRNLADMFSNLGRVPIPAKRGQMAGGRSLPYSGDMAKVQLRMQAKALQATNKKVAQARKANPEASAAVLSVKGVTRGTHADAVKRARKKADKEKEIASAKKLLNTRGADGEALKKATETLQAATKKEADRAKAAKAAAKARKEAEKAKQLTPEEKQTLSDYANTNLHRKLNGVLRGLPLFGMKKDVFDSKVAAIDSAIEKSDPLKEDKAVWRGASFASIGRTTEPFEPGTMITDMGFVSTSESDAKANQFGEVVFHVTIPAGSKALSMDKHGVSSTQYPDEQEILLPRGTRFEVVTDDGGDQLRNIHVRALPPEGAGNGTAQEKGTQGQQDVQGTDGVGGGAGTDNPAPEEGGASPADWQALNIALSGDNSAQLEAAQKIWGGDFGGYQTEVTDVSDMSLTGDVTYSGIVRDKDGNGVGTFARELLQVDGAPAVYNARLYLDPRVQGQGFATAFNKAAEENYRKMGVQSVLVSTDEVGGYAWARAGYDWDESYNGRDGVFSSAMSILDNIDSSANASIDEPDFYEQVKAQIEDMRAKFSDYLDERLDFENLPLPFDLSQVGYRPGESMWPGKDGMIGSNWEGRKKL